MNPSHLTFKPSLPGAVHGRSGASARLPEAAAERPQDFRKEVAAAQLPAERSEAACPRGAVALRLGVEIISYLRSTALIKMYAHRIIPPQLKSPTSFQI